MNPPIPDELRRLVEETVQPIRCSARRRGAMREELLVHLNDSLLRELRQGNDESAAIAAARQRFGDPSAIRSQLQTSVPALERGLFTFIGTRETPLSWVFWIASLTTIAGSQMARFPYHEEIYFASVSLLILMIVRHLCHEQNLAARVIGRRWSVLVGLFGIAFGPSIILPALARIKHDHLFSTLSFLVIALGVLVMLSGVGFIILAFNRRRTVAA